MTKQEFDNLPNNVKLQDVSRALAWFCVYESMNAFSMSLQTKEEREIIKIVLGKIKDGEISLD